MIIRSVALLATLVALCSTTSALAAAPIHTSKTGSHGKAVKTSSAKRTTTRTTTNVRPVKAGGSQIAALEAFPAGGKGSGTEATCRAWTTQLNADQDAEDNATEKQDIIDAHDQLNADKDNALDAGCAVID